MNSAKRLVLCALAVLGAVTAEQPLLSAAELEHLTGSSLKILAGNSGLAKVANACAVEPTSSVVCQGEDIGTTKEVAALLSEASKKGQLSVDIRLGVNKWVTLTAQRNQGDLGLTLTAVTKTFDEIDSLVVPYNKHNPALFDKTSYMRVLLGKRQQGARKLQTLAKLALVVYNAETTAKSLLTDFQGYKLIKNLVRHGDTVRAGAVFAKVRPSGNKHHLHLLVAFAGTHSAADWQTNTKLWKKLGLPTADMDLRVPAAWAQPFAEAWDQLSDVIMQVRQLCTGEQVLDSCPAESARTCSNLQQVAEAAKAQKEAPGEKCKLTITLTGHSLGGTQAVLAGYTLKRNRVLSKLLADPKNGVRVVTFGSPSVCSGVDCARRVDETLGHGNVLRVWNPQDPVPDAMWGYFWTPVGVDIVVDTPFFDTLNFVTGKHSIDIYWLNMYDGFMAIIERNEQDAEFRKQADNTALTYASRIEDRLRFSESACFNQEGGLDKSILLARNQTKLQAAIAAKCSKDEQKLWQAILDSRQVNQNLQKLRARKRHLEWLKQTDVRESSNILIAYFKLYGKVIDLTINHWYGLWGWTDEASANDKLAVLTAMEKSMEEDKDKLDMLVIGASVILEKTHFHSLLPTLPVSSEKQVELVNKYSYNVEVSFYHYSDDSLVKQLTQGMSPPAGGTKLKKSITVPAEKKIKTDLPDLKAGEWLVVKKVLGNWVNSAEKAVYRLHIPAKGATDSKAT